MLYNDLYPELELNMSNSNIGAMKKKNIRNHLFIVYGIINSVVRGESPCVDIQIFDLKKCFDALWLDDVMNDLFDSVPQSGQNDKLALLYKANSENLVSVKTSVGLTERKNKLGKAEPHSRFPLGFPMISFVEKEIFHF